MEAAVDMSRRGEHAARAGNGSRDRQLVDFIGRQGVATIEHVMAALGIRKAAAYRHTAACIEARLLERFRFRLLEPALLRATRRGLRYAGLGLAPVAVSPGSVDHRLRCTSTAQMLAGEFQPSEILTERELIQLEKIEERPIFSCLLPGDRNHRPDLAIRTPERTIAIELELTPKAPNRLRTILIAWRSATWVTDVRYYCEPGPTRRAVERAAIDTGTRERIEIRDALPG